MASHVVVLDSTARRAVIKTTPTKHLSDVLQEACEKLGLDPSRHGLKTSNNKTLDVSQPFRLSGLSSGAKLQLVVLSRSPSVVSVALQLPESEINGPSRLTDKFPSSTTLWLLLRHFESSSEVARNLTARGIPQMGDGTSTGAGRLYYETPVIHVMGRELVSFTDLQKTLAQLGFNSGSVLLRLSFRGTETPLEEAMVEIDAYFKSIEGENIGGAHAGSVGNTKSAPDDESEPILTGETANDPPPAHTLSPPTSGPLSPEPDLSEAAHPSSETNTMLPDPTSPSELTVTGPSQRPIIVYAPPSASTPAAARQAHNEKDYEPTIDHAKLHQQRLAAYGRNKTLPSDAEIAAQAEAQAKKNADVKEVRIKVRFPDQSQVISKFTNIDTTATLYEFVRGLMRNENEPFSLNFSTARGPQNISKEDNIKLIQGLGMVGGVLVNVVWEEGASKEAWGGKVLKSVYEEKAEEIEVKEPEGVEIEEKNEVPGNGKQKEKPEGKERKGGIPKWLKLPGKK